jgi:tungstate transport system ATP-binding protein
MTRPDSASVGPSTAGAGHADPATTIALSLTDVRVDYGGVNVLDIEGLAVRRGEILAVIGPNGSGKSTLLRIMALLERPAVGEIRWNGSPVDAGDALDVRRRMAVVFQQALLSDMTAADNVGLGLRFRGVATAERKARVGQWLGRFGISTLAERRAPTLSGGEAQRVALARALVLDPELLLLDEPFAGLDQPSRASLIPDLAAILRAERISTVLVTHDRGEAQALGDRVAVLIGGRLRQVDETAVVFRAPVSEDVARFVGVETIVTGEVTAADRGTVVIDVAGRPLEIAAAAVPGERVRVAIRPEDVTLMLRHDTGVTSSARNHLAGRVLHVRASTPHVYVVVDCGFALVAAVTPRSVDELGLVPGVAVTAVFQASAPHLIRDHA